MEYTDKRDRLATAGVLGLGVVVLVVAIVALENPGRSAGDGKTAAIHSRSASHGLDPTQTSTSRHSSAPAHSPSSSVSSAAPVKSSASSSSSASSASSTGSLPAPKSFQLVVMNNTGTAGLAAGAETRFEGGGWTVSHIGTMSNQIISTCAYYDPTVVGAKEAAEALQAQFPDIKRVAPRFAQLYAGPVVVVLTSDYKPA